MAVRVNADNFVRAETARMFDGSMLAVGASPNEWGHFRAPTPVDKQAVIRMNRDTLYGAALIDISEGASVTLPDSGGRYMTMMVIDEDHYINRVYDEPGTHELTMAEHRTEFVLAVIRIFVDPESPDDIAEVNALQDAVTLESTAGRPYIHPEYDSASLDVTREALLKLNEGLEGSDRMFGNPSDVEAVRHLIGTASGWGGLPETEAYYYIKGEPMSAGSFTMTLKSVPVDAFWSISIYNRDGYFQPNAYDSFSINSVTSSAADDGSVVVNLAAEPGNKTNFLHVFDGWNYVLRLYRPRAAVLDKTWTPPEPVSAD